MNVDVRIDVMQQAMGLVLDNLKATDQTGDAWARDSRRDFYEAHGAESVSALVGLASYLVHRLATEIEEDIVSFASDLYALLSLPDGPAWKHKRPRATNAEGQ